MNDSHFDSWGQQESFQEVMANQLKQAPWFLLSLAAHVLVLAMLWNVPWMDNSGGSDKDTAMAKEIVDENVPEDEEEPEEPPEEVEPEVEPELIDTEEEVVEEEILDEVPTENVTDSPFDKDQFNDVIGIGGGAGGHGKFGGRFGRRGRRKGSKLTQQAVQNALQWLAKHQDEDGKWDSDGFDSHCTGGETCEGMGLPVHDVGLTGLALLAFLGDGNTLRRGGFKKNVVNGIKWLKDQQDDEGLIGEKVGQSYMYSHIIAAIAMCEAFGLSRYIVLKPRVQKAINFITQARNPYKAWRYYPQSGDNDSSVTGWAVIALASAESFKKMGMKVDPKDFEGSIAWFDEMTDPNTGRIGYIKRGSKPARPRELQEKFPGSRSESITAVGLLARFFAHQDPRETPIMHAHADLLASKPPVWNESTGDIDMYYWYYASFAMYQMGGAHWKNWRTKMEKAVITSQKQKGCQKGSWDPVGAWGQEGGRVYSTAIMCLCMEVYYRYSKLIGADR